MAGVLALLACLAVVAATPAESTWIVDNGNRALVAYRLLESGYRDMDLGQAEAGAGFVLPVGGRSLSVFPPAYSALAAPWLAWLGPAGLRVPAALGVAASAWLFAAWLLPVLGRRRAVAAGLWLALGTPLFFYGVTIWDHSLTVAASLAAWRWMSTPGLGRAALAGAVLGASCWLREEMVLMVAALALARRAPAPVLAMLGGAAVAVGLLLAFNTFAFGDPLGVHLRANLGDDLVDLGAGGAVRSVASVSRQVAGLLGGYGRNGLEAAALAGAFVVSALASRWIRWVAWLGVAAWAFGTWQIGWQMVSADAPLDALVRVNGLAVQMPACCLAGAGLGRLAEPLRVGVVAGLLFALLATVAGVATQSYFGFGVHWGPRALLPALPALAALFWMAPGRTLWPVLLGAGLVSSALSVWLLAEQKAEGARLQAQILERPADTLVTSHPYLAQQLPELWRSRRVVLANRPETLRGELQLVVGPGQRPPAGMRCALEATHRGRLHYLDVDVYRCWVSPR